MVDSIFPIQLDGASISKKKKTILHPLNHTIQANGPLIILGPNGAGKTSLLRMIYGLEKCSSGSVTWNRPEKELRQNLSFVFQTPIVMRRSVIENIAYPLLIRGTKKMQAFESALYWAKIVGLGDIPDQMAGVLSGGEKQKLAVARALITRPQALFLDEPTTNLDGSATRDIENILGDAIQSGTNIIMTTHDIGQARRLAKTIIFLHQGRIVEHASAGIFFSQPKTPQAKAYLIGDIVD